ncbi:sensor histidine kinase [Runella sp.]|uniref:sensor histidine kinase n=1 Tax=Runella sp. TaxID=1960881 RepID=UPI003D0EA27C
MPSQASEFAYIAIAGTFLVLLLILFIVSFFYIFQKRQLQNRQEKANLHAQYQQEILQSQIEIQNQTLQHISGELHDNLGQLLSVVRFQLNILETQDASTPEEIRQVNDVVDKTIHELRGLSKSLDGDFVKNFGLAESLSHELTRIGATGRYRTDMLTEGETYRLDGQKEIVLFRVVQEILNNILKHAAAKHIKVQLRYQPQMFILLVQDDGKGFDYEAVLERKLENSGAGLRNIQRRTEMLGGTCSFKSGQNQGTIVQIELPTPTVTA